MTKQLLIYETVVPLNKENHKDLCINKTLNYSYARGLHQVPITAVEFPVACPEYAIVFYGDENKVAPFVVTGLDQEHGNLYVDDKGNWRARCVPAFVRRYPFIYGTTDEADTFTVSFDETYQGLNRDGVGEALFKADGEESDYLKQVMAFMEEMQTHFKNTELLCAKLVEHQLIEPMSTKVSVPFSDQPITLSFFGVGHERLKALSPDVLAEFVNNNWLELIYLHLQSIRQFRLSMEQFAAK